MSTAAQQLAVWLNNVHPELHAYLFHRAAQAQATRILRRSYLRGFGDDLTDFTPDLSSIDTSAAFDTPSVDFNSAGLTDFQPELQSVGDPIAAASGGVSASISTDASSSGFLQSIGSGIASAASSVGNFLTSAQGLGDLAKLGTAYFASQSNKANAQVQTAVLNAQVARASQGQSPLPITYAQSSNGQLIPVYASSPLSSQGIFPSNMPIALQGSIQAGSSQLITLPDGSTGYTMPPSIVGGLSTNMSLSEVMPWLLLIGLGLVILRR